MNTDVIDPAYRVGLPGSRVRQIRVARAMGIYKTAVAWEADGNLLTKIVRDKNTAVAKTGFFIIMSANVSILSGGLRIDEG